MCAMGGPGLQIQYSTMGSFVDKRGMRCEAQRDRHRQLATNTDEWVVYLFFGLFPAHALQACWHPSAPSQSAEVLMFEQASS